LESGSGGHHDGGAEGRRSGTEVLAAAEGSRSGGGRAEDRGRRLGFLAARP
jgi:hypothetical protein